MDNYFVTSALRDFLKYCVVSTIVVYLIVLYLRRRKYVQMIDRIPGPIPYPLFGNILQLGIFSSYIKIFNPQEIMMQARVGMCKLYYEQKLARIWIGPNPIILFFHPKTIEVILGSNVLIDKSFVYKFIKPWIGTGLVTSNGEKWRKRRKQLTPAFHFRILQDFLPALNSHAQTFVQIISKCSENEDFDLLQRLCHCTLDMIGETSMGVCLNAQDHTNSEYTQMITEFLKILMERAAYPWLGFDFIFYRTALGKKEHHVIEVLHDFTRKVIREKKAKYLEKLQKESCEIKEEIETLGAKRRVALLDLLMELHLDGNQITEEEMKEEVDTFMFAGHDTTAHALVWTLYFIGRHPEVQERILEELAMIFAEDKTRPVTMQDLAQMNYMECVMKESLRIIPVASFIGRELSKDTVVEGYTIPKGTTCFILPYETHHNPTIFPQPDIFDPDRFLPENCQKRHPYAYIPFSVGPRNCIGQRYAIMEEKIILSAVLRKFHIHSLDPFDKLHIIPEGLLKPQKMRIRFETR